MISALYNEDIIRKAKAIVEEAKSLPVAEREEYCQKRCGLTHGYLSRIGKDFKKPSARVIMNLGYEIYVKDLATGEFSKLETDIKCDWNPRNPRMNPSSTPVFLKEPEEISSTNE